MDIVKKVKEVTLEAFEALFPKPTVFRDYNDQQKKIGQWLDVRRGYLTSKAECDKEIESLRAQLAECEKDAERYRVAKAGMAISGFCIADCRSGNIDLIGCDVADEAIDKAMSKKG